MAYPDTLETLATDAVSSTPSEPLHYLRHNQLARVVNALQARLGAGSTTLDEEITALIDLLNAHNIDGTAHGGAVNGVVADPIFNDKGDLPVGTGANASSPLAAGANDSVLMTDSAAFTGLKWAPSQTPSTQAFGDAAVEGTADTFARGDHKHAMPNPALTPFDWKESVRAATTAAITLSGAQTIDGVSVIAGDRVLVKDQAAGATNGLYVAASGAWARSTDADISAEVTAGMATFVSEGTANGNKAWALVTNDPITLDTTSLLFTQIAGSGSTVPADALSGAGVFAAAGTIGISTDYAREDHAHPMMATPSLDTLTDAAITSAAIGHVLRHNGSSFRNLASLYVDARDYGVLADGVADDTAEMQAAIDAACAARRGLWLPPGQLLISATLELGSGSAVSPGIAQGLAGFSIVGAGDRGYISGSGGTSLIWIGAFGTYLNPTPMFRMRDCNRVNFFHFSIRAGSGATPLFTAFTTENYAPGAAAGVGGTSGTIAPADCTWEHVTVDGVDGTQVQHAILVPRVATVSGLTNTVDILDQNNDNHAVRRCRLLNLGTTCITINSPQSVNWQIDSCQLNLGKFGWGRALIASGMEWTHGATAGPAGAGAAVKYFNGGSYTVRDGQGGGVGVAGEADLAAQAVSADWIYGGGLAHGCTIDGFNSEKSTRQFYQAGFSGDQVPLRIRNTRFTSYDGEAVEDRRSTGDNWYFVRKESPGPFLYEGNWVYSVSPNTGGGNSLIRLGTLLSGGMAAVAVVRGNTIWTTQSDRLVENVGGTTRHNLLVEKNTAVIYSSGAHSQYPDSRTGARPQSAVAGALAPLIQHAGTLQKLDTAAASRTVTLPDAAAYADTVFTFLRRGANNVLIRSTSSQTINGVDPVGGLWDITVDYGVLSVWSDGANWWKLGTTFAQALATKTTTYTLTHADQVILADATSAAFTLTLPTAAGCAGRTFNVKKIDASANAVTIDGAGSETIDGALTVVIGAQWTSYTLVSNGTGWFIL